MAPIKTEELQEIIKTGTVKERQLAALLLEAWEEVNRYQRRSVLLVKRANEALSILMGQADAKTDKS